jgi:hypothetical protein
VWRAWRCAQAQAHELAGEVQALADGAGGSVSSVRGPLVPCSSPTRKWIGTSGNLSDGLGSYYDQWRMAQASEQAQLAKLEGPAAAAAAARLARPANSLAVRGVIDAPCPMFASHGASIRRPQCLLAGGALDSVAGAFGGAWVD